MEILLVTLLGLAAVAAVLLPVLRADGAPDPARKQQHLLDDEALDAEVRRYRAALRAGTVCRRCLRANPEDSRYCAECGRRLVTDDQPRASS